jgi:phenylacetate-CoA ligase
MLKAIKEKIAYLSRYNYLLSHEMHKIAHAASLDPDAYKVLQDKQLHHLIRHAAQHSPFYKKLYRNINTNAPLEEIYSLLPLIEKKNLREQASQIATTSLRWMKKGYTSGTSGTPLTIFRSPRAIVKEQAHVWYFRMSHGLHIGDPIVSLRGTLDSKTLYSYNKSENTLYLSNCLLSLENSKKYAALIRDFKPKAILAYPDAVFTLAKFFEELNIKLHVPLIFTSSETVLPFHKERIEQVFNGKLIDWYGNAERSISLGQCASGNYHEMPLYGYAQFHTSNVITTSLINRCFPLIKYTVDDTFHLMDQECSCGKGKGIFHIEGRTTDSIVLKDHTRVSGMNRAFYGVSNLDYAQVIQDNMEKITINLVTKPEYSEEDHSFLIKKVKSRVNESIDIEFKKIQEKDIIRTKAGKFRLVVSRL